MTDTPTSPEPPQDEARNQLAGMLVDFFEDGELGTFLKHIGFDIGWLSDDDGGEQLVTEVMRFYAPDLKFSIDPVASDLASYPPIAARVRESRRESYLKHRHAN